MLRLSKVSKHDGILSWSLPARKTCPGAYEKGKLVPVCQGCYASGNRYLLGNVKAVREANMEDWRRPEWVSDMIRALDNSRYFRWFDSGDVYCPELAEKLRQVIERTPWIAHWLPTKSYRVPSIRPVLDNIKALPNAVVRYSSTQIDGTWTKGLHGCTVIPAADIVVEGVYVCPAYAKGEGRCNGCRACWDKSVECVAYVAHGRAMAKILANATN